MKSVHTPRRDDPSLPLDVPMGSSRRAATAALLEQAGGVDAVEQQVRAYLQRYFLGRTPILNSKLAASPQGIIHDIINCPNVMVVGEQEEAWQNATAEIQAALSKDNEEEDEFVEEDDNEAELNAAIAEAMARKLKEKLQLKQLR